MTSYAADTLDISRLSVGDIIPALDFDSTRQAFVSAFLKHWADEVAADPTLPQYDVETIASDPAMIVGRAASTVRLLERAAFDDRLRDLLLVSSERAALDLIGTTYYGVERMIVPATAGAPEIRESDARYRLRLQLAPEAGLPRALRRGAKLGAAKSLGGYRFHALSCDLRVKDADAASLARGEVTVAVLAEAGNDPEVVATRVRTWLSREDVKGATDILTVRPAEIVAVDTRAVLYALHGPDASALIRAAEAAYRAFVALRGTFRSPLYGTAIDAALQVPGIETVRRALPAADVIRPFGSVILLRDVALSVERIGPAYA